jgi:hypothetical protein
MDAGAQPLRQTDRLRADDIIVSGQLSHAVEVHARLAPAAPTLEIRPSIPLRLIGLETHSGYSSAAMDHLWPFGMSAGVIDRVRTSRVVERHPAVEYITLGTPNAQDQIVSGIWPDDRWMSASGVVMVKSPAVATPLRVSFYIPENAPARRVTLLLDGQEVGSMRVSGPGPGELTSSAPLHPAESTALVEIRVDRTFRAPPDARDLGMVVLGVGFR